MSSKWIVEDKAKDDFIVTDDSVEFTVTPNGCNVFNAYYQLNDDGIVAGSKSYLKFHVDHLNSGLFLGLVTKSSFASGYQVSGYFFGGNLADGSCLLVGQFGKQPKVNDTVELAIDCTDDELKIYVIHNGRSLGLAYHVKKPASYGLFPAVQFYGKGKVSLKMGNYEEELSKYNFTQKQPDPTNTILGSWAYEVYKKKDQEEKLAPFSLGVHKPEGESSANEYGLCVRVANIISGHLKTSGEVASEQIDCEIGIHCSTLMMGSPEQMRTEHFVNAEMPKMTKVQHTDDKLIFSDAHNGILQFKRNQPTFEPYDKDPTKKN